MLRLLSHFFLLSFTLFVDSFMVSKLLLPYYDAHQVNYTLETPGTTCYSWRSLNPSVASVKPILDPGGNSYKHDDNFCTNKAQVVVESRAPHRQRTLIIAENSADGNNLQCDVIVDKIVAIDVVSRARELYLEDPPEKFQLRALDQEGNTFSTTAGIPFDWYLLKVQSQTGNDEDEDFTPYDVVRMVRHIDTDISTPLYVKNLETKHSQADVILVKGHKTGSVQLMVNLASKNPDVKPAQIKLTVRDKILLSPSGTVYISMHDSFQFGIEKWGEGVPIQIKLPNQQYSLQLCPDSIASAALDLNTDMGVVTGAKMGRGKVQLMDRNFNNKLKVQESTEIVVTEPSYIQIMIPPLDRAVLQVGLYYHIQLNLFDANNHRIMISENYRIKHAISDLHLEVYNSNSNGSWYKVKALACGRVDLSFVVQGINVNGKLRSFREKVEGVRSVDIYDLITIDPPVVVFPIYSKYPHYRQLICSGGSGNYTWRVNDSSLINVNSNGFLTTKESYAEEKPKTSVAEVWALDSLNPFNMGKVVVVLQSVSQVSFLPAPRETEMDGYLDLYVTMLAKFDSGLINLHDCRKTNIKWTIENPSIFEFVENHIVKIPDQKYGEKACVGRRLHAIGEGTSVVKISYEQLLSGGGYKMLVLDASVTIASYRPLQVIDPVSVAVVTLDSSKIIRFVGGPQRWALNANGFRKSAYAAFEDTVELTATAGFGHEHRVTARCLAYGSSEVTLRIGNQPCDSNPFPRESLAKAKIQCAAPARIELTLPPMRLLCPLRSSSVQVISVAGNTFVGNITAYDHKSQLFDNFTSLDLKWVNSDELHAKIDRQSDVYLPVRGTNQRKQVAVYHISTTQNFSGEVDIQAYVNRYRRKSDIKFCSFEGCMPIEAVTTDMITLQVAQQPKLDEKHIILYNSGNSSYSLNVLGGSGHFVYKIKEGKHFVEIERDENQALKILPNSPGRTILDLRDLCLPFVNTAELRVAEVGKIVLKAPMRMEIGNWSTAFVYAYDVDGKEIPSKFLPHLKVYFTTEPSNVVTLGEIGKVSPTELSLESAVSAKNVGSATVTANIVTRDGRTITSNPLRISVFPPLETHPNEIELLKHASIQLRTRGGPPSDFTVRFNILDSESSYKIANVSHSGIVNAYNFGEILVVAQAVTTDGEIFHSKVPAVVRVKPMSAIRINSPVTRFIVGATVPLHVSTTQQDGGFLDPFSFGSANPGLTYEWKVSDSSVLKIVSVYEQNGIHIDNDLRFSMYVLGLASGSSTVSVIVTSKSPQLGQLKHVTYTNEINFKVHEPLRLKKKTEEWKSITSAVNSLLLTTSMSTHLITNRDVASGSLRYHTMIPNNGESLSSTNFNDDCMKMNEEGVLTTLRQYCDSTVLITSMEEFSTNQTLLMQVSVRPVAYVLVRPLIEFRVRDQSLGETNFFPTKSKIPFSIEHFDEIGRKFDFSNTKVGLSSNRDDILQIEPIRDGKEFSVQAPLPGMTVLKIYTKDNMKNAFYFPLNAKHAINPAELKVPIGGRTCLKSDFLNRDGSEGSWDTSNSKLLNVDSNTGALLSNRPSSAFVTYTVDSFSTTSRVEAVSFVASFDENRLPSLVSNFKNVTLLPITMTDDDSHNDCMGLEEEMDQLASQLFFCSISFVSQTDLHKFYSIKPRYSTTLQSYVCEVTREVEILYDPEKNYPKQDHVIVELKALRSGKIITPQIRLPYLISFHVKSSNLRLDVKSPVSICLVASPPVHQSVTLLTDHPNLVSITAERSRSKGNYCYRIQQLKQASPSVSSVNILLYSTLTDHQELVNLRTRCLDGKVDSKALDEASQPIVIRVPVWLSQDQEQLILDKAMTASKCQADQTNNFFDDGSVMGKSASCRDASYVPGDFPKQFVSPQTLKESFHRDFADDRGSIVTSFVYAALLSIVIYALMRATKLFTNIVKPTEHRRRAAATAGNNSQTRVVDNPVFLTTSTGESNLADRYDVIQPPLGGNPPMFVNHRHDSGSRLAQNSLIRSFSSAIQQSVSPLSRLVFNSGRRSRYMATTPNSPIHVTSYINHQSEGERIAQKPAGENRRPSPASLGDGGRGGIMNNQSVGGSFVSSYNRETTTTPPNHRNVMTSTEAHSRPRRNVPLWSKYYELNVPKKG